MIFKKVMGGGSKGGGGLIDYLRDPASQSATERLLYTAGRGFIGETHAAQRAEFVALASGSARSANPVSHYVLSWREGEQPSPEQVERSIDILLEELGLSEHLCIYALHGDTDNVHLHIAINRVHPDTLKVIKPNKGFDIEAGHRAIARIEAEQGWQPERDARYALVDGELVRVGSHSERKKPSQKARDFEQRTGEKSAERIAQEAAAEIIKSATSWQALHAKLAQRGMRYERKGSGAILWVGEQPVKASRVSRGASLSALQKRLGPYQEPPETPRPRELDPIPIKRDMPRFWDYAEARRAHYAAKAAAKAELDARHAQERQALAERQKSERQRILAGDWRGKGEALNALRSVLAAQQAAEKASLKERHRHERAQWRMVFPPYPDFEQWLRSQDTPELAERWRHRASEPQIIKGLNGETEPPTPRDIRAYTLEIIGSHVYYYRADLDDGGPDRGSVSFVDTGKRIEVHDWRDPDTTLAALQLAAQKWGHFSVSGCDEYKALCVRLAAEHGFKITNPELQEGIEKERQRLQQERAQAMKSEQLKQFERYAEAVGAERYRVTAIKMREDGTKQTFILDKKDGITRGFTPEEIAQRLPEMLRLQRRGENLYYTPLSDTKHHILIDDMSREKLERLINDGYKPAVVLESSPGNYQALITIPKLGTPHDRDVGNRLAERLNREYGDPKLSGCIHPHRAPGFENRKPKHRREDGTYPEVRLLKAERRECGKTLELARQIDAEYQQHAAQKAAQKFMIEALRQSLRKTAQGDQSPSPSQPAFATSDAAVSAYWAHYRDVLNVLKRQGGGDMDLSRVDAMIAVRMRVTGHDQTSIEVAIRQCAPAIRTQDEGRDWDDYAQRTATYAFSFAGDQKAQQLAKYRPQWERLEERAWQRQQDQEMKVQRNHSKGMGL